MTENSKPETEHALIYSGEKIPNYNKHLPKQ